MSEFGTRYRPYGSDAAASTISCVMVGEPGSLFALSAEENLLEMQKVGEVAAGRRAGRD